MREHRTALGIQTAGDTGLLQCRVVHSLDRLELLDQGLVLGIASQNVLHSQDGIFTEDYIFLKVKKIKVSILAQ